jgi:hypothetical protein
MLKKQKIVRINDVKLKTIRLNLRKILTHVYNDHKSVLQAIWLGAENMDEKNALLRELEDFRQNYRDSIIVCRICSRIEGDRVYYPRHKCWYCTDCMKKGFIPSKKDFKRMVS